MHSCDIHKKFSQKSSGEKIEKQYIFAKVMTNNGVSCFHLSHGESSNEVSHSRQCLTHLYHSRVSCGRWSIV